MTQLSNVPMQPNPSAVERTLTLIEKLEEYHQLLYERWCDNHKHPYDEGAMDAVEKAINIVKQHGDWISVDERLPPHNNNEANTPKILGDSKTYGVISVTYDAPRNLWFTYGGDDQIFDITSWMFAPEPPSEVQA